MNFQNIGETKIMVVLVSIAVPVVALLLVGRWVFRGRPSQRYGDVQPRAKAPHGKRLW